MLYRLMAKETMMQKAERLFDVSHAEAETDLLILLICRFVNMIKSNFKGLRVTKNISFLNTRDKRQKYIC